MLKKRVCLCLRSYSLATPERTEDFASRRLIPRAERQKEAAIDYARGGQAELSQLKTRMAKLEPSYVTAIENRVTAGLEAAKAKLVKARDGGDIDSEVDAQKSIAQLGIEEVRLNALKDRQSQDKEREVKTPTLQDAVGRTPPPDPKAEAWAEKNAWFGKDNAMTYTAFDYHKKLTEEDKKFLKKKYEECIEKAKKDDEEAFVQRKKMDLTDGLAFLIVGFALLFFYQRRRGK